MIIKFYQITVESSISSLKGTHSVRNNIINKWNGQNCIFSIKDKSFNNILKPELRIYNQPNIITSEADIKITLLQDNFITINTVKNEDYFNVRYMIKPFMLWIWVSVLLIALGGLISLFNKKHEE